MQGAARAKTGVGANFTPPSARDSTLTRSMKTYRLNREQFVRRPMHEEFRFFERPENLALISPPWLGFRILNPSPILMKKGTVIEYSIRVMGVRLRWQSLISEYAPRIHR